MRSPPCLLAVGLVALTSVLAAAEPDVRNEPNSQEATPAPQQPPPEESAPEPFEEESDQPAPIPAASDSLGGHFVVSGAAGVVVPFGQLEDGLAQRQAVGTGAGFALELAYGVSRTVVVGAWGQFTLFGSPNRCEECTANSIGFGPMLRYHLVQGMRFDPWLSVGAGYQSLRIAVDSSEASYSGLAALRLIVGGDWYAFSAFGFGPFLQLDSGLYLQRPDELPPAVTTNAGGGSAPYFAFSLGARVAFDAPGK